MCLLVGVLRSNMYGHFRTGIFINIIHAYIILTSSSEYG